MVVIQFHWIYIIPTRERLMRIKIVVKFFFKRTGI